jgi:glycosyltransferase involved in cell wall biosynthesis
MGIPVICNSGVGDVEEIVLNADAGFIVPAFSEKELLKAVEAIPQLLQKSPSAIRSAIENVFSLEKGVQSYLSCYRKVLK